MTGSKCYLYFTGYYAVTEASDVLLRFHIDNRIVRSPVKMNDSCGFALVVRTCDEKIVEYILERENIRILKKECI